jgi:hypothetical protein
MCHPFCNRWSVLLSRSIQHYSEDNSIWTGPPLVKLAISSSLCNELAIRKQQVQSRLSNFWYGLKTCRLCDCCITDYIGCMPIWSVQSHTQSVKYCIWYIQYILYCHDEVSLQNWNCVWQFEHPVFLLPVRLPCVNSQKCLCEAFFRLCILESYGIFFFFGRWLTLFVHNWFSTCTRGFFWAKFCVMKKGLCIYSELWSSFQNHLHKRVFWAHKSPLPAFLPAVNPQITRPQIGG